MPVASSQPIPVTWTATMPGDSNTYYPVAILKDTRTGAIIQQINLQQDVSFSQRYSGVFSGVPDPSGLGRFFDVTVFVYTDVGQSILSQNYQIVNESFRTFDIALTGSPNGPVANSGIGTNYKRIEEMFIKALESRILTLLEEVKGSIKSAPKTEIAYEKISKLAQDAARLAATGLSGEMSNHFVGISKMLDTHKKELLAAHGDSHAAVLKVFDSLSKSIGTMGKDGKMSAGTMQSGITAAIEQAREDIKKHHTAEHGALESKFDESSSGMGDTLKGMLTDKEIRLQIAAPEMKKEKKEEKNEELTKPHSADEMKALLGG